MTKHIPDKFTRREVFILSGAISVMASVFVNLAMRAPSLVLAAALLLLSIAFPMQTLAKQESTDARLLKVFRDVDDRALTLQKKSKRVLGDLEQINKEIDAQEQERAGLASSGLSEDERTKREHVLTAKIIAKNSRIYKILAKHFDDRAALVSKNLEDLGKVVKEIQRSGRSGGGTKALQVRIDKNVATGRAMRGSLRELQNWAAQNPRLATKSQSLRRLMKTLDRKISLDKVRLSAQGRGALSAHGNRTVDVLNGALDRLADQYAEIATEKVALQGAREELRVAVEISRLRVTERIARKSLPGSTGGGGMPPLLGIVRFTEKIGTINDRLLRDMDQELSGATGGTDQNEFNNF